MDDGPALLMWENVDGNGRPLAKDETRPPTARDELAVEIGDEPGILEGVEDENWATLEIVELIGVVLAAEDAIEPRDPVADARGSGKEEEESRTREKELT